MDFTLHTTFPESIAPEWNVLLEHTATHVPFLRHEYLHYWWSTRGGGEWPEAELAVVTARQEGHLVGVAPLFFTANYRSDAPHPQNPELLLLGSVEISDYLDLLVRPQELPAFLDGLLPFLAGCAGSQLPAWQALDFYNILDSSPTLPALEEAARRMGWRYVHEKDYHAPYIPLPGDWETYLAGIDKKQRHEIRRKMRRIENSGLPVRWYLVTDGSTLDSEVDAFLGLMEQDAEKANFLTPPMREHMHLTARLAFDNGYLFLAFLEIAGVKAAAYLCFDYLNRIWVYNSGFTPSMLDFSPGWVLLGNLLRWSNEQQREAFDFMRGDEEYKYRFGGIDRFVLRAVVER